MALSWTKNLRNRIIVGIIGAPLILAVALIGGWFFFTLVAIIMLLSILEVYGLERALGWNDRMNMPFLFAAAFLLDCYVNHAGNLYPLLLAYIAVVLIGMLGRKGESRLNQVTFRFMGTLYITLFLGSLILVREYPYRSGYFTGGKVITLVFIGIWALDTFAYFSGSMFGKHKLIPRISPGKTVEGSVGGTLGAVLVIITLRSLYVTELPLVHAAVLGIIIAFAGQLGDIIESYIKRKTGVKDSSSILPGHGGILDRFDSMIFTGPFVYLYLKWLQVL